MSGDMMAFPDTVEEFMEQYKIVDREQVYSNGIEFVPIFRMQQWFDHVKHSPDDLRGVVFGTWLRHQQGRWVYAKCSRCETVHDVKSNYCPYCGARMGGVQDALS